MTTVWNAHQPTYVQSVLNSLQAILVLSATVDITPTLNLVPPVMTSAIAAMSASM
jgi:hypothetical protein